MSILKTINLTHPDATANTISLTSDHKVGIGTTTPGQTLHVNSGATNTVAKFESTDAGAYINFTDTTGTSSIGNDTVYLYLDADKDAVVAGSQIRLRVDGSTKVTVNDSGNVGIGTTSPGSRFEVVHSSTPIAKFTGATNAYVDFTDGTVTTRLQNSGATYFGTTTNHGMIFRSNATDRMIVASDGKVGIGTNAPVEGNLVVRNDSGNSKINIKVNSFDGTNGIAALDFSTGGQAGTDPQARIHAIGQNNYSADLVFSTQISGTSNPLSERMRILSNGRVVIGTTSAVAWNGAQGNIFAVAGSQNTISSLQTSSTSANQGCIYEAYATATTSGSPAIGSIAFLRENTSTTAVRGYAAFYTNRDGNIAEKMRLASDGHLSLNTTSDVVGGKGCKFALNQAIASGYAFGIDAVRNTNDSGGILIKNGDTQGTHYAVSFFNTSNSIIGSIVTSNGGTSFNTSSDYRLKENVVNLTGAIDRVKQIPVHRFNFIAEPDKTIDGFIAHEVSNVVPEAVTGEKDAVDADGNIISQGIDQAKLVPLLTAALQEAIAEIENLKTRIEALEG